MLGLELPAEKALDRKLWDNNHCEVVVAGGSCCHGYLMGLSEQGIQKILELDFNIYRIIPLVCRESSFCFLVSGAGCSGEGVRLVDFGYHGKTPTSISVFSTEESQGRDLFHFWSKNPDPLKVVPNIWERLAKKGFTTDREETLRIQPLFQKIQGSR
jgi:hypothetical protein